VSGPSARFLKIPGYAYYRLFGPVREFANESAMTTITLNNQMVNVDAEADTPLLWVLRDHLGMTGTKFGCGMALCGACTVHIDGAATRSCVLPLSAVEGKSITTIEGLSRDRGHAVQKAWLEIDVPQCGYCQSGQIMSAAALLKSNPKPSDADIDAAMSGNICRCGTYPRIRKAIHRAAELLDSGAAK
jgi:isoquinoline 1-oxidoreductase subunit alpha